MNNPSVSLQDATQLHKGNWHQSLMQSCLNSIRSDWHILLGCCDCQCWAVMMTHGTLRVEQLREHSMHEW